ncbi:M1 family metallopeptidase [Fulvivirgaceae bacterium BMA10]|uniref:M1 family metallopeptidase n=2 Tax=Splendidivirga corallicola TaxID=3051826 RepID=A0ABT8KIF0_9BACT|nr:M1 family metallopeptidase [Fulvivirgaceae bacterium BMA10]
MLLFHGTLFSQSNRWQQAVEYKMDIQMDVKSHQFKGKQNLIYTNNSPDTLNRVFYHLYFNAFQPGSMMDVRSRNIQDPDGRVKDRISKLKENEIGYQKVASLTQNGKAVNFEVSGTILEVTLNEPILPGAKTEFNMEFKAQVPLQIRRSGRDNHEGIAYSMTQWYPKLAEYDHEGWHSNPYIGREFHGVWGDFDVKITIDSKYTIGGTGYLQNPDEIGHGYEDAGTEVKHGKGKLTWHFVAKNVMDFAWGADADYTHTTAQVPNGPKLHFFYQSNNKTEKNWTDLKSYAVKAFEYMNEHFGKYPYEQYSFVQGGDGGMEYPMATLLLGETSFRGLVGTAVHELIHSWYQHLLGTNESLYAWMDEGFTSYATSEVMSVLFNSNQNPHKYSYLGYLSLVKAGLEEPSSLHADHFNTNRAYSISAYSKGAVFLNQLKYIIGKEAFDRGMLRYFNTWKFKHPTPNDFIRIMEKESGLELHWYLNYWIHTTKTIDYAIKSVKDQNDKTQVTLERIGEVIMPIDLLVEYKDGSKKLYYIPLRVMRGEKKNDGYGGEWIVKEDWPWTYPTYTLEIEGTLDDIKKIEIDPKLGMADTNRDNNQLNKNKIKQLQQAD